MAHDIAANDHIDFTNVFFQRRSRRVGYDDKGRLGVE